MTGSSSELMVISGRLTKPAPDARILRPSSCHLLGCLIRLRPVASSAPQTPVNSPLCTSRASRWACLRVPYRATSEIELASPSNNRAKDKSAPPKIRRNATEMALILQLSQARAIQGLAEGRHRKPGTVQSRPEMCAQSAASCRSAQQPQRRVWQTPECSREATDVALVREWRGLTSLMACK